MKAIIDKDEWYPCYSIIAEDMECYGTPVEVPDELAKRYNECMEEFWKIQTELKELKDKNNSILDLLETIEDLKIGIYSRDKAIELHRPPPPSTIYQA